MDFARAADPVLDQLLRGAGSLLPPGIDLTLSRVQRLLSRMGAPHAKLPPVFHVAGTNGKGSTAAFLRAGLEAAGATVHVFTSPHLVRVNERVRVAGRLVDDGDLADALAEVMRFNAGQPLSFFEVLTAAAFLLFAATPADATVLEVGLGGRLDATNVVPHPAVTGVAALAMDHAHILGPTIRHIAAEKAGISKPGVPLVTMAYPPQVAARVVEVATLAGAPVLARKGAWDAAVYENQVHLRDAHGTVSVPVPRLAGAWQADNLALAMAMLRAQAEVAVPDSALRAAALWADWPARMQKLAAGPLTARAPGAAVWVDGAHNPAAARAVAQHLAPGFALVLGVLGSKDYEQVVRAFAGRAGRLVAAMQGLAMASFARMDRSSAVFGSSLERSGQKEPVAAPSADCQFS